MNKIVSTIDKTFRFISASSSETSFFKHLSHTWRFSNKVKCYVNLLLFKILWTFRVSEKFLAPLGFLRGQEGGKSWIYFLLAYMMKDIEIFIMLFTGWKNIDFSRRYVPKKLVFYTCESRLSRRFSRNFDLQNSKSISS